MEILIVDCNEDMLILFGQKFRKEIKANILNFSFFDSGESTLEYINSDRESPALVLILSDIGLPGISGTQLLEILKSKHREIKVFTIDGIGSDRSRTLLTNLRADYYFNKPIQLELIKTKILQLRKILG